jgi:hypothetical protein
VCATESSNCTHDPRPQTTRTCEPVHQDFDPERPTEARKRARARASHPRKPEESTNAPETQKTKYTLHTWRRLSQARVQLRQGSRRSSKVHQSFMTAAALVLSKGKCCDLCMAESDLMPSTQPMEPSPHPNPLVDRDSPRRPHVSTQHTHTAHLPVPMLSSSKFQSAPILHDCGGFSAVNG